MHSPQRGSLVSSEWAGAREEGGRWARQSQEPSGSAQLAELSRAYSSQGPRLCVFLGLPHQLPILPRSVNRYLSSLLPPCYTEGPSLNPQQNDPPTPEPEFGRGFSCGEDSWMLLWSQESLEAGDCRKHLAKDLLVCWRQHTLHPAVVGKMKRRCLCVWMEAPSNGPQYLLVLGMS